MEQAQYWMWTKRRSHGLSSHLQATTNMAAYDDSWEEQAFAEDTAGSLGGCIWPPRSYSCSFCGREFRSAQALGGHMNVHRRDRARLKQSPTPQDEILHHDNQNCQNHIENPFFHYQPDEVCNFVCNPNPNSDHGALPSPSSTSRVSLPPTTENCPEQTSVPPLSSPIIQEYPNKSLNSSPKSCSSLVADRYYHFSDLRTDQGEKSPRILESGCRVKADNAQTDLSVSLNLVVRRTRPATSTGSKEETVGCKRKRTDTLTTLPFFLEPISIERHHLQPADEVPELSPSSVDDIDLELRLGVDRPKVK
ncbi:hypothetical protein PTKIN_Ptkin06aG0018700 [Pterospermum kingtungense]